MLTYKMTGVISDGNHYNLGTILSKPVTPISVMII